jgi:hypothetical protein
MPTAPAMTVSNTAVAKLTVIHTAPPSPQAGQQISRIIQLLPEMVNASTEISTLNKQTRMVTIAELMLHILAGAVLNLTLSPGRPTVTAAHAKAQTECMEESGKLAPAPTVTNSAPAMTVTNTAPATTVTNTAPAPTVANTAPAPTVSNTAVAKLTVIHTAPPSPQTGIIQHLSRIIQLLPQMVNASTEISSLNKQTFMVTIA